MTPISYARDVTANQLQQTASDKRVRHTPIYYIFFSYIYYYYYLSNILFMTVQNVSASVYYSTILIVFMTFLFCTQTDFGTERKNRVICTMLM